MSSDNTNANFIFFTGGVVSSVGKGVTTAAIGKLLKERGFKVTAQKLDPYINVDPGTMSPYQHGEVFVLDDGSETDLDLGHYERFMDIRLNKECNVTTGQVYAEVIAKERHGDYLGSTIQVIPHITNEIKRRIMLVAETTKAEFVLVEVGGTVGDIESLPFLESIRQLRADLGHSRTFIIHLTWLPYIGATGEIKTKPTQHSVRELRSIGLTPNMIIARSDYAIGSDILEKISAYCDVEKPAIIPIPTTRLFYEIPLLLEKANVGRYLLNYFNKKEITKPDWKDWRRFIQAYHKPKNHLRIAIVGKYVELHDAYLSVKEALMHASLINKTALELDWIHSVEIEHGNKIGNLINADGIVVPGGFGKRGIEGKITAVKIARENKIPYLGLCLGMQLLIVEYARYLFKDERANSTEFDKNTPFPVIDLMPDQKKITKLGGTMRLGLYPCELVLGTHAHHAYKKNLIFERHRHRFEVNNSYRKKLESGGLIFSGLSPDGTLAEIAEIKDHPFMLGTQFHPEFLSRLNKPHPLFNSFIKKSIYQKKSSINPS